MVYAPARAKQPQGKCLDQPQALNHGVLAAAAGIALLRAFKAIDWTHGQATWDLSDADGRSLCFSDLVGALELFVRRLAAVLMAALKVRHTTGRDSYLYRWKYEGGSVHRGVGSKLGSMVGYLARTIRLHVRLEIARCRRDVSRGC